MNSYWDSSGDWLENLPDWPGYLIYVAIISAAVDEIVALYIFTAVIGYFVLRFLLAIPCQLIDNSRERSANKAMRQKILSGMTMEKLRASADQFYQAEAKYVNSANLKRKRRARQKLEEDRAKRDFWNKQSGEDFELEVGSLLKERGYKVSYTPKTGDAGIDLIVEKESIRAAVQCKRYKSRVAVGHIREFIGAMYAEGFKKGYFIAAKGVTGPAMSLAEDNKITIVTVEDLISFADGKRKYL